MISKVIENLSNINNISKIIIKYGSFFSYFLLACAIIYLSVSTDSYSLFLGQELIKTSLITLGEFIIFGLFIDLIQKMNSQS